MEGFRFFSSQALFFAATSATTPQRPFYAGLLALNLLRVADTKRNTWTSAPK